MTCETISDHTQDLPMEETLKEFEKNAKAVDNFRDMFKGKFITVLKQKVIDSDNDFKNLLNRIDIDNLELYVGYVEEDCGYMLYGNAR